MDKEDQLFNFFSKKTLYCLQESLCVLLHYGGAVRSIERNLNGRMSDLRYERAAIF